MGTSDAFSQSVDSSHVVRCGSSPDLTNLVNFSYNEIYNKYKENDYDLPNNLPPLTLQQNFQSANIIVCGNFKLYYKDINSHYNKGFDDTITVGGTTRGQLRRNILCEVLNYFQNIYYIPSSDTLDIYIDSSFTSSNPTPYGLSFAAQSCPYYTSGYYNLQPGVYNGNFYDHIINGYDPDTTRYDAYIQVNFDRYYIGSNPVNILYWDDTTNLIPGHYFDLYSILLHELLHCAGWISNITEDVSTHHVVTNGVVSRFDSLFLYYGDVLQPANFQSLITYSNGLPVINSSVDTVYNAFRHNKLWMTNYACPNNDPIYSGTGGLVTEIFHPGSVPSHLADDYLSFSTMLQYSPGFYPNYVMGPVRAEQEIKRNISLNEIRYLHTLGYQLNQSFANSKSLNGLDTNLWLLTQNHPPYRLNNYEQVTTYQPDFSSIFNLLDTISANLHIINSNTFSTPSNSYGLYDLLQDSTLGDIELDSIKIYPGSLYGIRGCGDTLPNNHNQIEIIDNGTKIKYTPFPGYWGRAQCGFNIWDGHEKGAFKIITIDVSIDSSFNDSFDEYILNGTFEDITELRQIAGPKVNFIHSSQYDNRRLDELNYQLFASGNSYNSFGTYSEYVILNSEYNGEILYNISPFQPGYFGKLMHRFGSNYMDTINRPLQKNIPNNEVFKKMYSYVDLNCLKRPLTKFHNYVLSYDIIFSNYFSNIDTIDFKLIGYKELNANKWVNYSNNILLDYKVPVDSIFYNNSDNWQHFTTSFSYCGNDSIYFIRPYLNFPLNIQPGSHIVFIDNISIRSISDSIILEILTDTNKICIGDSVNLNVIVSNNACFVSYLWNTGDTNSLITVNSIVTTTYTVTVTTGGIIYTDSITITVYDIPEASPTYNPPVCTGGTLNLYANLTSTGNPNYSWSGPSGFSAQIPNPIRQNANSNMSGIYYLTVSSEYGCGENTYYISVTVDTALQPHGNLSYYFNCQSDTLFLYASSGYPYYFWYGPQDFWSINQNPILPHVNQNSNGYYYLIVENSIGCVALDSIYINVTPIMDLTLSSNAPICAHDTLKLYSTQGNSYSWSGPNGFVSSNQNPIILDADTLNNGYYYCYMYDSLGCHYNSKQADVFYCCSDSAMKLIADGKITQYSLLPSEVAISGELTIAENYVINSGTHIVMLPKSSINIIKGVKLQVNGPTHINGCQELWESIYVQDSAGLIMDNSLIEDAEYAITAYDYPELLLVNNHFHKNYVSLYIPEPSQTGYMMTLNNLLFSGNEFDCKNDVLLSPMTGQKSYAGVLLNSEIAVPLFGKNVNYYHHMRNGIIGYNSNLEIQNSKFYNISDPNSQNIVNGCGIYVESDHHPMNLVQKGWGTLTDTSFYDCEFGVKVLNMNAVIIENKMSDVVNGIYVTGSPHTLQQIDRNIMDCKYHGISMLFNDPITTMDICYNTITMNSDYYPAVTWGISLVEMNQPPYGFTKIHNNIINMDTCYFGIMLQTSRNSRVYENIIRMNKPEQNFYGITLNVSPGSIVSCNEVYGIDPSLGQTGPKTPRGMKVTSTTGSKFSCNYFSNTKIGASFENWCADDSIRGNTFVDNDWGLHYNSYAVTGPQKHQGNEWLGSFSFGAMHEDTTNFYVFQSRYRCKINPYYFFPPSVVPNTGWFFPADSTTYTCNICPKEGSKLLSDSLLSPIDYAIVSGLAEVEDYHAETQWLSSKYLYSKLLSDSLLITIDPIMQNFYDTILNASPGRYQNVNLNSKEAIYLESASKILVDSLSQQIHSILSAVSLIDSLLRSEVSYNDSMELLNDREGLVYSLMYFNAELETAMQEIRSVQESKINSVLTQNGSLPSSEVYEQNEKEINDIYLTTVAKGVFSFSPEQISIISGIASQCPLAGGNAVYSARSLFALIHDTIYDDNLLCYLAGFKNKQDQPGKPNNNLQFKIYPNPASDNITIEWQNVSDDKAKIEFINPLGQVYYDDSFLLSDRTHVISIIKWDPGVYQVCIEYSNRKVYCDKLVIVR